MPEQPEHDLCAHGCSTEATVQHADGRYLCLPCYTNDTGGDVENPSCPTCGQAEQPDFQQPQAVEHEEARGLSNEEWAARRIGELEALLSKAEQELTAALEQNGPVPDGTLWRISELEAQLLKAEQTATQLKTERDEWKAKVEWLDVEAAELAEANLLRTGFYQCAEVKNVERELERLRGAIEDYLLWRPGEAGHAEAHRKLAAALSADTPAQHQRKS